MNLFRLRSFRIAIGVITCIAVCLGCSQNEIIEDLDDAGFNTLMDKYNIQDIEESELNADLYKDLQPIKSISELDSIIKYVNKYFKIPSTAYENTSRNNESSVKITRSYSFEERFEHGLQVVFMELNGRSAKTTGSAFYQTFLWDAVMTYQHEGDGGTYYSDGRIHFVARGYMALKLLHKGLLLKKIPTVMEGVYNPGAKRGRFITSPKQ